MQIIAPKNGLTTTLEKALDEVDAKWRDYDGIIITGSWPGKDDKDFVFEAMDTVKEAKAKGTPLLGICFGHQIIGLSMGLNLKELSERRVGIKKVGDRYESFWHDYAVYDEEDNLLDEIQDGSLRGVQYHPEYQSNKDNPHIVLKEFIEQCKNQ